MESSLAVITVVYNNYTILDDFFASFNKQTDKTFHIFVADLSSNRQDYAYPDYVTAFTAENKGYAHGVNEGVTKAQQSEHTRFCIINSDVVVAKDFVAQTKKALQEHPKTIIGGKIYYAKGYEFHKGRYSDKEKGNIVWFAGGRIDWDNMYTFHRGVDQFDNGQYERAMNVDFITGCMMAYDSSVVDTVGRWDSSYFLYYEDTDYCVRAAKHGIPLLYVPSIVLWHKNAQSTEGSGSQLHQKYQERNRFKFGMKYAPWKTRFHLVKNAILATVGIR